MCEQADHPKEFMTLGEISDRLKTSRHQLKYAIDQYRIAPAMRVGIIRVWSSDSLPLIQSALSRIASNRSGAR